MLITVLGYSVMPGCPFNLSRINLIFLSKHSMIKYSFNKPVHDN